MFIPPMHAETVEHNKHVVFFGAHAVSWCTKSTADKANTCNFKDKYSNLEKPRMRECVFANCFVDTRSIYIYIYIYTRMGTRIFIIQ